MLTDSGKPLVHYRTCEFNATPVRVPSSSLTSANRTQAQKAGHGQAPPIHSRPRTNAKASHPTCTQPDAPLYIMKRKKARMCRSRAGAAYCRSAPQPNPTQPPRSTEGRNAARERKANAAGLLGLREGEVFIFPVLAALEDQLVHEGRAHGAGHGAEPEEPVVRPDAGHGRGAEGAGCRGWGWG